MDAGASLKFRTRFWTDIIFPCLGYNLFTYKSVAVLDEEKNKYFVLGRVLVGKNKDDV